MYLKTGWRWVFFPHWSVGKSSFCLFVNHDAWRAKNVADSDFQIIRGINQKLLKNLNNSSNAIFLIVNSVTEKGIFAVLSVKIFQLLGKRFYNRRMFFNVPFNN